MISAWWFLFWFPAVAARNGGRGIPCWVASFIPDVSLNVPSPPSSTCCSQSKRETHHG